MLKYCAKLHIFFDNSWLFSFFFYNFADKYVKSLGGDWI